MSLNSKRFTYGIIFLIILNILSILASNYLNIQISLTRIILSNIIFLLLLYFFSTKYNKSKKNKTTISTFPKILLITMSLSAILWIITSLYMIFFNVNLTILSLSFFSIYILSGLYCIIYFFLYKKNRDLFKKYIIIGLITILFGVIISSIAITTKEIIFIFLSIALIFAFLLYIPAFPIIYILYFHSKKIQKSTKIVKQNNFFKSKTFLILFVILIILAGITFMGLKINEELLIPSKIVLNNDVPTALELCKLEKGVTRDACIELLVKENKNIFNFGEGEICEEIVSTKYKDKCYTSLGFCDNTSNDLMKKTCNSINSQA